MSEPFVVSRRRVAMMFAGTLAASGTAAAAFGPRAATAAELQTLSDDVIHRQIGGLLSRVREARTDRSRRDAFERCKRALALHDSCRMPVANAGTGSPASCSQLYRGCDSATMLARVIVRELDTLPIRDGSWLERFGDLEAAFASHLTVHERAGRFIEA